MTSPEEILRNSLFLSAGKRKFLDDVCNAEFRKVHNDSVLVYEGENNIYHISPTVGGCIVDWNARRRYYHDKQISNVDCSIDISVPSGDLRYHITHYDLHKMPERTRNEVLSSISSIDVRDITNISTSFDDILEDTEFVKRMTKSTVNRTWMYHINCYSYYHDTISKEDHRIESEFMEQYCTSIEEMYAEQDSVLFNLSMTGLSIESQWKFVASLNYVPLGHEISEKFMPDVKQMFIADGKKILCKS